MDKYAKLITSFLVGLALAIFIYGIVVICFNPSKDYDFPEFLQNMMTSISTILSANLAIIIGFAGATGRGMNEGVRYKNLLNPFQVVNNLKNADNFKIFCAFLYLICLMIAVIIFAIHKFNTDDLNPMISQFVQTLVGLVIAALAIRLNVEVP